MLNRLNDERPNYYPSYVELDYELTYDRSLQKYVIKQGGVEKASLNKPESMNIFGPEMNRPWEHVTMSFSFEYGLPLPTLQ